jgi:xylono-1,5-lactonase
MDSRVECVWPVSALLGEGPVWSAADGTLWFVDIKASRIHAYVEAGGTRSFESPEFSAFVFRDRRGGMVCGLRSGLFHFDPATGSFDRIARVDQDHPRNRLNDGYVDAAGRLWFGTMDNEHADPTGSLYRFANDTLARMDPGYVITNGPTMSPDARTLYHVDTFNQCVHAFDVDARGDVSGKRLFLKVAEPGVYPDGPTIDAQGNLWISMWGGGCVRCYSPLGALLHSIELPVSQCTKAAFGGADLRTLYITTASTGLSEQQRARQPLAGALFRVRVDVPGLPANEFAG